MRCAQLALALSFLCLMACGSRDGGGGGDDDDDDTPDACVGLACFQVDCDGGGTTSISGVVHAPNGTLPLYNVNVYIPTTTVEPFEPGAQCDRCGTSLSGNPLVKTTTDTAGRFTLTDMPATDNVPVVIQVGKWRRQITVNTVTRCEDTPIQSEQLRLPKDQSEGDIPLMALSTGGADALECLLRKIGLEDSEFNTRGGGGRVHLFAGNPDTSGGGTDKFDSSIAGGAQFAPATELWDSAADMSVYDVVFLSCEGNQNTGDKPTEDRAELKEYTRIGGRVFASHWHNVWLQGGPDPWDDLGTWDIGDSSNNNDVIAEVNTGFDRGMALANWLVNVQATVAPLVEGEIELDEAKHTLDGVDDSQVDTWISVDDLGGNESIQYFSFTTPIEEPAEERCGRVVFSDIHVSAGDEGDADFTFPSGGCNTDVDVLTPQEKVLAFMIFDIASCIGPIVD